VLFGIQLRDPVASLTHLFGFVAALYFTALFWRLGHGNRGRQLGVVCFGLSMCLLYGASSSYHAVLGPPGLINFLRRLDHSAIYVLIAGTYTPIYVALLRGRLRVGMLVLMWSLAAVGIVCKWALPFGAYRITVTLYVLMGWTGLASVISLVRAAGWRPIALGVLGGVFYTIGAVCDALKWPVIYPGVVRPHEVLHIFDLFGTFVHVVFIIRYVVPFRGVPRIPFDPGELAQSPGDTSATPDTVTTLTPLGTES
jgi:hemolysin III